MRGLSCFNNSSSKFDLTSLYKSIIYSLLAAADAALASQARLGSPSIMATILAVDISNGDNSSRTRLPMRT
jgi:hypothetical protein